MGSRTGRAWEHTLLWRTHYPGVVPGVKRLESKDDLNLTWHLFCAPPEVGETDHVGAVHEIGREIWDRWSRRVFSSSC